MVVIEKKFFIVLFFLFFITEDMCKMIFEKNKSRDEIREALFDEAFNRMEIVTLNDEDKKQYSLIKSSLFQEGFIKPLSLFTEKEIFNLFLKVNQDDIFTPGKFEGKDLINLKLVLLLLTSLDRELGRDQELKEIAFDLYKKINNFDESIDKEFREKNIFCWDFFQKVYPKEYVKKTGLIDTLKSFFNMSDPEYLVIVEYGSDLPFYKKLPFRMFGLFLAPLYKSYFPYYQLRDKRIKVITEINKEF